MTGAKHHRLDGGRGTRALVVDDDPILRSLLKSRLGRLVDHVVEAPDGLAAWRLLTSEAYHIALVDLMMPNLNGYALIQCMRGHPRTRHMPIVVVSSNNDKASIEKALEAGASAFLTKPLTWSVFDTHINHLMRLAASTEMAELALHRHRHVADAQAAFAAAVGAFAHARFRRLAVAADRADDPPTALARLAGDAESAKAGCERLRSLAALVGSAETVNSASHPIEQLLTAAVTVAADEIVPHVATVAPHELESLAILASRDALIFALVTALRAMSGTLPVGAPIEVACRMTPEGLVISLGTPGTAWPGFEPEQLTADLAMAAQATGATTDFDLAVVRTLLAAHGGQIALAPDGPDGVTFTLTLPEDRLCSAAPFAECEIAAPPL